MHTTLSFGLLITCLLSTSFAMAVNPAVVPDEKLHGILPVTNQQVTYLDVVDCGSTSQADLFRRARLWMAQSFATNTFVLHDKETGDIVDRVVQTIVLPRSENFAGASYSFQYSFAIECTNRKYRATITQIGLKEGNSDKFIPIETYSQRNEKDLQLIYSELDRHLKGVLVSLQENVKNYKAF